MYVFLLSWTVSGSKEAMGVPKNFQDLRKLGVRNIAHYSAANVLFSALLLLLLLFHLHSFLPDYPPCLQKRVAATEAKPRFGAALVRSAHDCETGLSVQNSTFVFSVSIVPSFHNKICQLPGKISGPHLNRDPRYKRERPSHFRQHLISI